MLVLEPDGGAVFSAAASRGAGSLLADGGDNDVSRLTGNILRAFVDEDRLPFGR